MAAILASALFFIGVLSCTKTEEEKSLSPNKAPDLHLQDLAGKTWRLSEFSNQVVLINFWATWCAPCVAEMPSLERLYQTFKDQGFRVVAINVDASTQLETVRQFVETHGLTFPVLLDPQLEVTERYGVKGFPESFFIGRDGMFLSVVDPQAQKKQVKIISDRPWDSKRYLNLVKDLLEEKR